MTSKQSAAVRPEPTPYRKAAIALGGVEDHSGKVRIESIPDFDLDRTIFKTLEGTAQRLVVKARVGQEVVWDREAGAAVDRDYQRATGSNPLPEIPAAVIDFMVDQCDFDVEHADGSFLDHLYFCFEYSAHHFPDRSPLVMLLHSILGTGTNTFAMSADKIPALRELLTDFEWAHVEAFPSVLRLLYDQRLRRELRANVARFDRLESIEFRRVIDNQAVTMSANDLWVQLNYQLIHLIDFLPVANWRIHTNDTSFILFRDLYGLLESSGKLAARIDYAPGSGRRSLAGEPRSLTNLLSTLIPVGLSERMAARSVRTFSERIGHSLEHRLNWARQLQSTGPMEATVLTKVVLPIALAVIMLGMGLSLVVDDFRRVLKFPRAFAVGVFCQFVMLPAVGFGLAYAIDLPAELKVGLIILALCPGGTTSNMFTFLARGDVALSISLTAVVSVIAPFTIPIFGAIAMNTFMGESAAIELPFLKTVGTLLVITVVPVVIGMVIRKRATGFADRAENPVKILSVVFLVAIIAGIMRQNWADLGSFFAQVGWAALALNVITMAIGFGAAVLFRLSRAQTITVGLEVGIQNGTTAILVTATLLANNTMAIAPAIYSLIMFGTGAVAGLAFNLPGSRGRGPRGPRSADRSPDQ